MILQYLQAIVLALITLSVPFVATGIAKLFVISFKYLTTKYGVARTNQIAAEALKIWHKIDEDTRLGYLISSKYDAFMLAMSVKFPLLTNDRILEFNKDIAGEFNKNKAAVIKELEPVIETKTPIIKYYDAAGVELTQVVPTV